jgi:hypothetical protein
MSDRADVRAETDSGGNFSGDMLLQVRALDPAADAEAVRRYAREIAEADTVLQTLDLDPSTVPLEASFSPDWNDGRTP